MAKSSLFSPEHKGLSETQLVPIRIADVEISLAPFRISRGHLGREPGSDASIMEPIHVRHVKDDSAPRGRGVFSQAKKNKQKP